MRTLVGLLALSFSLMISSAQAAQIRTLYFDRTTQMLHIEVIYRGGELKHNFEFVTEECRTNPVTQLSEVTAHLIDSGKGDPGQVVQSQSLYFDVSKLNCKPAYLLIWTGNYLHTNFWIAD